MGRKTHDPESSRLTGGPRNSFYDHLDSERNTSRKMIMKKMNYQLLGRSGLRVSDLCLGTMTFGEEWGWGAAKDEARKIYDAYREAGGNFIDTANIYTNGSSEKLVGEFVAGHREEVVVATKYTNAAAGFTGKPGTDANAGGNQRKNMVQAVEASLKRLGTATTLIFIGFISGTS
jgi:aryl-alcohol dehydrogenase-like predicted oxidoreductase